MVEHPPLAVNLTTLSSARSKILRPIAENQKEPLFKEKGGEKIKEIAMSEEKIRYDETYKRLFSNPKLVEELERGLLEEGSSGEGASRSSRILPKTSQGRAPALEPNHSPKDSRPELSRSPSHRQASSPPAAKQS